MSTWNDTDTSWLDEAAPTPPPSAETAPSAPEDVPATLARLGLARDGDVAAFTRDLRAAVSERVELLYGAVYARRPHTETRPSKSDVAPELQLLSELRETLAAVGKVFTDSSRDVDTIAGDVVLETLTGDREQSIHQRGGSASVTVGARGGGGVRVTYEQPRSTSVDTDKALDALIDGLAASSKAEDVASYALGARDALQLLRSLIGPPSWKITALEQLRQQWESAELDEPARALASTFGRVPKGKPRVKIEHTSSEDEA